MRSEIGSITAAFEGSRYPFFLQEAVSDRRVRAGNGEWHRIAPDLLMHLVDQRDCFCQVAQAQLNLRPLKQEAFVAQDLESARLPPG